jgi:hypothetical protein
MEKIIFDSKTFVWKHKLNLFNDKEIILNEVLNLIEASSSSERERDAYTIHMTGVDFIGNIISTCKLDDICQLGINHSISVYDEQFNKVNFDAWVNIVRSKNPVQHKLRKKKYHVHTEIQENAGKFFPHYTYVYYIQMPDVMDGEDGVLYFKGEDNNEYWIRPEEDDLIVIPGHLPHSVGLASKSNKDRIVLAGNVGFDMVKGFDTVKQTKTLL